MFCGNYIKLFVPPVVGLNLTASQVFAEFGIDGISVRTLYMANEILWLNRDEQINSIMHFAEVC